MREYYFLCDTKLTAVCFSDTVNLFHWSFQARYLKIAYFTGKHAGRSCEWKFMFTAGDVNRRVTLVRKVENHCWDLRTRRQVTENEMPQASIDRGERGVGRKYQWNVEWIHATVAQYYT